MSSRRRRNWYYPLISLSVALGISVGTPQIALAVPWFELLIRGAQIVQLSNISDEQEVQLGRQMDRQLVGREFQLYRNARVNRYVNRVGQRLAKNSTRPNIPYTFQVVRDNRINAFATTGGYIYVTAGLLNATDNEAQLAAVLAHEIGHIAARHTIKQMREAAIAQGIASAAGIDNEALVQLGVDLAIHRPRSREAEYEADRLGVETLARAGYPQVAMIDFLEKLRNQPSPPAFLSTHPATEDRIARLRELIDSPQAGS
ncbi:Peptidase family M48 [Pleurocapsa sp. PCC 7327]|uniref:M48 family metallopeptidase n=1 Tax=Pleurocapsa sp. PCC 7327 TaxID=118163 RepID=UPI00029FFAEB|nr:M48 family metallopeptidase [Pleurocapsa sp. PCC 7327]AFY76381.1 Peptidase family M48 [Pleurocapsa sp. PCC 7327]